MTNDNDIQFKSGRGGKRPGAGRPPGTKKPGPESRIFTIRLTGEEAEKLVTAAETEGIRPGAWILRAVRKALDDFP